MNEVNKLRFIQFSHHSNTNSIQVPIDYKLGDTDIPMDIKQGAKFHSLEVLKSYRVRSHHCGIMLEISIKRYLKITTYFQM